MDTIFRDESRIKKYAQIQRKLCLLNQDSNDDQINEIINEIPQEYLNQKEDLMMICQLFACNARIRTLFKKSISIKLFNRILEPIKTYLHDESSFLWNIFGGIFYFKYWMYKEGLISMETIIQKIRLKNSFYNAEYFLPEIIDNEPEIFEKEIKQNISGFSPEYVNEFKQTRQKYFKWLIESSDYNDPLYSEIERDKLRLAIKLDDIDSFQKIISNLNIPIDSKISESVLENFFLTPHEIPLIEFASKFNSIKIFKFLIMNEAKITDGVIYDSICHRNYEMFHIIESHKIEKSIQKFFYMSILFYNDEMTEYVLNNYDNEYEFLFQEDIDEENDKRALEVLTYTITFLNFQFFESTYLPFLRKNPLFVKRNIHSILHISFKDRSGFFTKEVIEYPEIDVNHSKIGNDPLIIEALRQENIKAIELFLNDPKFDINFAGEGGYHPLIFVCSWYTDMKILKMFCNHPKIDINLESPRHNTTAFQMSVVKGNTFAIDYFFENDLIICNEDHFHILFFHCIMHNHLYPLEVTLKFYMKKFKNRTKEDIFNRFKAIITQLNGFQNLFFDAFKNVLDVI